MLIAGNAACSYAWRVHGHRVRDWCHIVITCFTVVTRTERRDEEHTPGGAHRQQWWPQNLQCQWCRCCQGAAPCNPAGACNTTHAFVFVQQACLPECLHADTTCMLARGHNMQTYTYIHTYRCLLVLARTGQVLLEAGGLSQQNHLSCFKACASARTAPCWQDGCHISMPTWR